MSERAIVRWCGGYMPGKRVAENLGYDLITGVKHLTQKGLQMRPREVVFNFGHSGVTEELANCDKLVNPGWSILNAVNKIKTFDLLHKSKLPIPYYTISQEDAQEWVDEGETVYCRMKVGGLGGLDIVLSLPGSQVPKAPLYTEWLGDDMVEYRGHVFDGVVLVRQQKKRMGSEKLHARGIRKVDPYVRVHNKGWVFAEQDIDWPADADVLMAEAVEALGLTFGTVDFQHDPATRQTYILEVNTAPGMENRNTFNKYCDALRRYK